MYTDNLSVDADFDALSYSYEKTKPIQGSTSLAERSLWCAVIEQAFIDAHLIVVAKAPGKNKTVSENNSKERDEALRWLLRDKQDFTYICSLAGVSPAVIRRAAQCMA
jgi:hypothetical protein